MTTVWLFKPRSHGRKKEGHPRAQRGPVAGATSQFSLAPSIGVSGFVPVWARSIFSSSCVVVRAWWEWELPFFAFGLMAVEQQRELQQLVQQQRERLDVYQHWEESLRVSEHIVQNSKRPLRFRRFRTTSGTGEQRLRGRWRWTEHTDDADDGRRLGVPDVECG